MGDLPLRFLLGGAIVSAFAAVGEMFEPKTFAGLFGAAPSVAVATLAVAYGTSARAYVAHEGRSMLLGAAALLVYSLACVVAAKRPGLPVWLGALLGWLAWGAVAFAAWYPLHVLGVEP